ncbi:hypothetical protein M3Y99_00469700 [Aphelenchoides fujianensis]|nr:hypothetical protein M3Y99_00469700 [Aphelenchoides fujianensis]
MSFVDKAVIITGSSSGIGQASSLLFAKKGANITIHGQNAEKLQRAVKLLQSLGIPDSTFLSVCGPIESESVQKRLIDETVEKFGRVDVLVNNAGLTNRNDLEPNALENFDHVMNVNVRAVISLTRLAVPELSKTKGAVVNVSSAAGHQTAPSFTPYCLSKAALDHYTRNAAVEYAPLGIRVNCVSPGFALTSISEHYGVRSDQMESFFKSYVDQNVPLGRFAKPEEIGNCILFLASPKSSYITGANLYVDGGMTAGRPAEKKAE